MARVTFSLDEATIARVRQVAVRRGMAQSHVVREAVAEYAARTDRLDERERQARLAVLDRLRTAAPTRSARAVDAELRDQRKSRRTGARRHPA